MAELPIATQCGTGAPAATPLDSGLRRNDETGRSNGCHLFSYEGMKSRSCGLVQRIGAADSATPHPDPCGGQAPALHFLIPPSTIGLQFGTFRRRRTGMEGDWRAHPGSESGTCFRANRSCRLPPAHQGMKHLRGGWWRRLGAVCATPATPLDSGLRRNDETGRSNGCHLFSYEGMKSRSCGLVQRIGAADSATPHPDPCGGQAPALHFLIPPSTIGLQFGTFRRRRAGMEGDWRAHPGSESGTCFHSNRSCRLAPAHQGMKIAGVVAWYSEFARQILPHCPNPRPPCGGQAPALTFSHSAGPGSTIGLQFGTPRHETCCGGW